MPNGTNGRSVRKIVYSDISGGKNNSSPQNAIGDNQVSECINAIIEKRGFSRVPGLCGIKNTSVFSTYARTLDFYTKGDGTEYLFSVSNSHVYHIDKTDGDLTDLGAITGDGEVSGFSAFDKYFFTNGSSFKKDESGTLYNVGIVAPSGASASASGVGTIPAGTYAVYISYARKINGVIVLYSMPQSLGNVTVNGSQAIAITCPNSTDTQVTDKIVWMKLSTEDATYQWYDNTNNTSTTFSVTDSTGKNILLVMEVESLPNEVPDNLTGIVFFDGYTVGWYENKIYWSIQSGTAFDLEKFPPENFRTFPHNIISIFSCSGSFYINTVGGIYRLANGDLAAKAEHIQKKLHFLHPNCHKEYKGIVWGLTNDGVRFFDGEDFSIDLSKDIKPDIDSINFAVNYYPVIEIFRREGKRTELHLSFRDITVTTNCNNRRLVLNLDSIVIESEISYKIAWEEWTAGFNYSAIDSDGKLYCLQNRYDLGATIFSECLSNVADTYIYNRLGTFLDTQTNKTIAITFKAVCLDIFAMAMTDRCVVIAKMSAGAKIELGVYDNSGYLTGNTLIKSGGPPLLFPFTFPAVFPANNPNNQSVKFPMNNGKLIYIKFEQTANDTLFNVFELVLHTTLEESNLT